MPGTSLDKLLIDHDSPPHLGAPHTADNNRRHQPLLLTPPLICTWSRPWFLEKPPSVPHRWDGNKFHRYDEYPPPSHHLPHNAQARELELRNWSNRFPDVLSSKLAPRSPNSERPLFSTAPFAVKTLRHHQESRFFELRNSGNRSNIASCYPCH